MKNKKVLIFIVVLILILCTIFIIFNYKKSEMGNTINKSEEEIIDYILNISSYKAIMEIEVQTNKNKTQYIVKQIVEDKTSKQEVIQPENIAGVVTEYNGTNLKISNNKLNLSTTYENYEYIVNNKLWMDSFIKEYREVEDKKVTTIGNEIILELKNEKENKYSIYKKLYIDKKTAKPTKMIIEDINQNEIVYILYTEIEIS